MGAQHAETREEFLHHVKVRSPKPSIRDIGRLDPSHARVPSDELVSSFAQSDHVVTGAMRVRTSEAQWNAIPLIPPLPAHDWLRKDLTPMRFRGNERLLLPVTPDSVPGRNR